MRSSNNRELHHKKNKKISLPKKKRHKRIVANFKNIRDRHDISNLNFKHISINNDRFEETLEYSLRLSFFAFPSTWLDKPRPVHVCVVLFPIRRQCGDPLLSIPIPPPLPPKQSLRFPRERVTRLSRYVLVRKSPSVYKSENFDDYREEEKDQPPTRHLINFHFVPFAFYIHGTPIFASRGIDFPKVETRINIGGKICEARYDSKGEKKTIFLRRWKKKISRVTISSFSYFL